MAAGFAGAALVDSSSEPSRAKKRTPAGRDAPRGFVRFRDRAANFSIAYPGGWIRLPSPGDDLRLLAAHAGASFSVRVSSVGIEITSESLGPARRITDELVTRSGPIRLLRNPARVSLARLPGYLYLYSFRDSETRQRGIHAHYFLFRGRQLYTLVFQALPAKSFRSLTRTFDAIAETLRVRPPREGVSGTT